MYLSVIFFPLIGALTSLLFGRFLGKKGSIIITTTLLAISAIFSSIIFYEVVLSHSVCSIKLGT